MKRQQSLPSFHSSPADNHRNPTIRKGRPISASFAPTIIPDLCFGFYGRAQLTLRDSQGNIIRELNTAGCGANGRFIPGAKHDRFDAWSGTVTREEAKKLKSIDFHARPRNRIQKPKCHHPFLTDLTRLLHPQGFPHNMMLMETLPPEQAPPVRVPAPPELVRRAEQAVENFHGCFWFWHPEAKVRYLDDIELVIRHLREYGGWNAWQTAQQLRKCL